MIEEATGAPRYETALSVCHQGARYSVRFDRNDAYDGRPCFLWNIDVWEGGVGGHWEPIAHGDDLRLGAADEAVEGKALAVMFTFLGAFAESINYGGGRDGSNIELFPDSVRSIARGTGSDEYAMLATSVWPEDR